MPSREKDEAIGICNAKRHAIPEKITYSTMCHIAACGEKSSVPIGTTFYATYKIYAPATNGFAPERGSDYDASVQSVQSWHVTGEKCHKSKLVTQVVDIINTFAREQLVLRESTKQARHLLSRPGVTWVDEPGFMVLRFDHSDIRNKMAFAEALRIQLRAMQNDTGSDNDLKILRGEVSDLNLHALPARPFLPLNT